MIEHICGKLDRCKHAAKCPHKQRPIAEYLYFERNKCISTTMKKQEAKNDGR